MPQSNADYLAMLKQYARRLPKRRDGRIDYEASPSAPVLSCFVRSHNDILLIRRSRSMEFYPELWGTVSGFLDEVAPLKVKVEEELSEELAIRPDQIDRMHIANRHTFDDKAVGKTWLIYSVLVDLRFRPGIELNHEHDAYAWIPPGDVSQFATIPGLEQSLDRVLIQTNLSLA